MRDLSQYGEHSIVKDYFKINSPKHKIVIDVGARGFELSNSINFIMDLGWKGILIEPCRKNYSNLRKCLEKYMNVFIINAAVADYNGKGKLFIHKTVGHNSLINESEDYEECEVFTLTKILEDNRVPHDFDLLTVDAEGMDERILKYMFENSNYRPEIIIHEKDNGKKFGILFSKFDYMILNETKGNCIYRRIS